MKKNLVTGIQPSGTGVPHLGNFLGVIRNLPQIIAQNDRSFVFIADIHATTVVYDPHTLRKSSKTLAKSLLASGVPEDALFVQSSVSEHFEMGIIIQHLTTIGQLENMTQYKSKAKINEEKDRSQKISISTGLLTYPALMAGDIMLYQGNIVPAGEDQVQHVQYVRDIVESFNKKFKTDFMQTPSVRLMDAKRIMSLNDPLSKMSKSSDNQSGVIYLTDTEKQIVKKYKRAVTGSKEYVEEKPENNEPGTLNLLQIISGLKNKSLQEICQSMAGKNFASLKNELIETHEYYIAPIREKMLQISDEDVDMILEKNKPDIKKIASDNIKIIKNIVGF